MTPGTAVFLAALAVGQGPSVAAAREVTPSGVDLRCGAYCLYAALGSLDLAPSSFEELEARLGQPTSLGYSLQQLEAAAKDLGAFTLGVETSLGNLLRRPGRFACIALLERSGHFVCVYDADEDHVYLIDPPESRKSARDAFSAVWSGKALLLSDRPIDLALPYRFPWRIAFWGSIVAAALLGGAEYLRRRRAAGDRSLRGGLVPCGLALLVANSACTNATVPAIPRVDVEPRVIDLGHVEIGGRQSTLGGSFRLGNRGTGSLRILTRDVSCGCTVLDQPPATIRPGLSVAVPFGVRPRQEPGAHSSVISLGTNDPATPEVRVEVRWVEHGALAFEPRSLHLGRVVDGRAVESQVELVLASRLAGDAVSLVSDNDNLTFSLERVSDVVGDSAMASMPIRVRLEAGRPAGAGAAFLRAAVGDTGLVAELPVTWRTGPRIEVSPKGLFQSNIDPASEVRHGLVLSAAEGSVPPLVGVWVDEEPIPFQMTAPGGLVEPSRRIITFSTQAPREAGIRKKTVRLILDGVDDPLFVSMTLVIRAPSPTQSATEIEGATPPVEEASR